MEELSEHLSSSLSVTFSFVFDGILFVVGTFFHLVPKLSLVVFK